MKIYFNLVFLLSVVLSAQNINGKILSKESNKGLPYVSIFSGKNLYLTTTDEEGNFSLELSDESNKLIVDHQGYDLKNVEINNNTKKYIEVFLDPQIIELNETVIFSKSPKIKKVGNNGSAVHIDFLSKSDENRIQEIAVRLKSNKKAIINKINLGFKKLPKKDSLTIRVSVYNEKDNIPDKTISKEDLIYKITNDNLIDNIYSINLKEKKITVEGSFFISVQIYNESEEAVRFGAGFLGKNGYFRRSYKEWDKMPLKVSPQINAELIILE